MTDREHQQKLRDAYSASRADWYRTLNGRYPEPSKSKGRPAQ